MARDGGGLVQDARDAFGQRLKMHHEQGTRPGENKRWLVKEFAEVCGFTDDQVKSWRQGKGTPNKADLDEILLALGKNAADMCPLWDLVQEIKSHNRSVGAEKRTETLVQGKRDVVALAEAQMLVIDNQHVYLSMFDIGPDEDLGRFIERPADYFIRRMFFYGCIAQSVSFQWSAVVKSKLAHNLYYQFKLAFRENEAGEGFPIFRCNESSSGPTLQDAVAQRKDFVQNDLGNSERLLYNLCDSVKIAKMLDRDKFPLSKPTGSVAKTISAELRKIVRREFRCSDNVRRVITEESHPGNFQTYRLLNAVQKEVGPDGLDPFSGKFGVIVRNIYNRANGLVSNGAQTEQEFYWQEGNVNRFCDILGVNMLFEHATTPVLVNPHNNICADLFAVRQNQSVQIIRKAYFSCRDQREMFQFLDCLKREARKHPIKRFDCCRKRWDALVACLDDRKTR